MSAKAPTLLNRLKITLVDIEPPIWRRIEVRSSIKLCCLHTAIQVVMGWNDTHLHQFKKGHKRWGIPEYDEFNQSHLIDESKAQLGGVLKAKGDSMLYEYDFGDDWQHEVVLEEILPAEHAPKWPVCFGGERHCPPEDVGGTPGYEEFLKVIFNSAHEDYKQHLRWVGGHFVDEFDPKPVNDRLQGMRWPVRHRW